MTTLADYYRDAGVFVPAFAESVQMKWTPFPHQIIDLAVMCKYDRSGLFNEAGTGKTIPMQAYAMWLAAQGNRGVCVMPPVLIDQFHDSFLANFIGCEKHISIEKLVGTVEKRARLISRWDLSEQGWPDLLLMSAQMFVKYREQLQAKGFNFGVFDEATLIGIKTPSSKMHKAVKMFGGNCRHDSNGIVLATGTPVETNVTDAYGLIAIINPDRYGSWKTFEKTHCIYTVSEGYQGRLDKTLIGYKNFDILHQSLMLQGRRVLKSDVNKDLPPRLITELPITLSRRHRELYDRIVDERIAEVGDRVLDLTDASALYQGMQRLLLTPEQFTDEVFDNVLMETVSTLVESLEGKKIVMYAWYQASVDKLAKHFAHLRPAVLNGNTSESRRTAEKMRFINDPLCGLAIANPRSGGVGIDGWQHVSSHAIFVEVCPFPGTFQQAIARLHRTGQTAESVNVYVCVPTGTIAVKLRNDLIKKDLHQEMAQQDKRTVLMALRGEGGLRGSLDEIDKLQELEGAAV